MTVRKLYRLTLQEAPGDVVGHFTFPLDYEEYDQGKWMIQKKAEELYRDLRVREGKSPRP